MLVKQGLTGRESVTKNDIERLNILSSVLRKCGFSNPYNHLWMRAAIALPHPQSSKTLEVLKNGNKNNRPCG